MATILIFLWQPSWIFGSLILIIILYLIIMDQMTLGNVKSEPITFKLKQKLVNGKMAAILIFWQPSWIFGSFILNISI